MVSGGTCTKRIYQENLKVNLGSNTGVGEKRVWKRGTHYQEGEGRPQRTPKGGRIEKGNRPVLVTPRAKRDKIHTRDRIRMETKRN